MVIIAFSITFSITYLFTHTMSMVKAGGTNSKPSLVAVAMPEFVNSKGIVITGFKFLLKMIYLK